MVHFTKNTIQANGIHIHYHRTGGDKPSLLLLHGLTDNGLCWTRVAKQLKTDYDIIMPDARGHGESDKPEDGYHPLDHANDVIGLIKALELESPILMGHSMGADVAFTVAAYVDVRAVILEDPPWWQSKRDNPRDLAAWREEVTHRKSMTLEEIIATCEGDWHENEIQPWAESKQQLTPNVINYAIEQDNYWRTIREQVTCPVLLVTADVELGAIVIPQVAQEVVDTVANAKTVHIPDAGHSIHREQFDAYMKTVTDFLNTL